MRKNNSHLLTLPSKNENYLSVCDVQIKNKTKTELKNIKLRYLKAYQVEPINL